jgi:hypothetical protein
MKMSMYVGLAFGLVAAFAGLSEARVLPPRVPVTHGKLRPANHAVNPGWDMSKLPRWQLTTGGKTYYLEFRGSADFDKLAEKLQKCWYVKVIGRMETRAYGLSRLAPPNGGAVTDDALTVNLPVIVVEIMAESELESAPAGIEIRGTLHWTGNHYFLEKNGLIRGTLMGCEWEGYELRTKQGTYRVLLDGGAADLYLRGWNGKTAVIRGRIETRVMPGWLTGRPHTADVLIVDDIQVQ